ncbi:MAG: hypothetical protein JST58_10425 [Bacteroidetes bacterium]|nr:hypothetical protein [Bacteroidota bacterium]
MTADEIWRFVISLSVAFPAIVGLIRIKKIDKAYYSLFIYIIVSLLSELSFGLITQQSKSMTIVIINWFNLFEAIILLTQFKFWEHFDLYTKLFPELIIAVIVGWIFENLFLHNLSHFHVYFLIAYSFLLVLLSVQTINHIIVNESRVPLIKNPKFIICVAIIIFFTYTIFVYTLMAKGIDAENKKMMSNIFSIKVYVNAFANILYGIALLFVQKKVSGKDLFKDLQ